MEGKYHYVLAITLAGNESCAGTCRSRFDDQRIMAILGWLLARIRRSTDQMPLNVQYAVRLGCAMNHLLIWLMAIERSHFWVLPICAVSGALSSLLCIVTIRCCGRIANPKTKDSCMTNSKSQRNSALSYGIAVSSIPEPVRTER